MIVVVTSSEASALEEDAGMSSEALLCFPSRLAASSENRAVDTLPSRLPSRERLPATASYKLTECPTSRNRRAVSASRAMF